MRPAGFIGWGADDLGTSRPFAAGDEKLRPGGKTARDSFERWDSVDETNRDSFPASDPPSWTGMTVR